MFSSFFVPSPYIDLSFIASSFPSITAEVQVFSDPQSPSRLADGIAHRLVFSQTLHLLPVFVKHRSSVFSL